MGVTIQWDNSAQTVLRYELARRWTWDEFYVAFADATTWVLAVPHAVDFILYPTDRISQMYIPPNTISHVLNIDSQRVPNGGHTVIVAQTPVVHTLLNVLMKVNSTVAGQYSVAKTLDEARTRLQQLNQRHALDAQPKPRML